MDKHYLTSVIIPVYNGEKYIKRCLDSVLQQDDINLEVIVINDGSFDRTDEIMRQYEKDDVRVKYHKQENRGVSSARNVGLSNAIGEYVIFVDADDYIPANSLSERIKRMVDCDLLVSGIDFIDETGCKQVNKPVLEKAELSIFEGLQSISPRSKWGYQGFLFNKVFRKKIIDNNNVSFDEEVLYGEDRLFVGEYMTHCNKIVFEPEIVYFYNKNNQGVMAGLNNITKDNENKIITEFIGLQKIEAVVKPFDKKTYRSFRYFEFRQALKFLNRADATAKQIRKYCYSLVFMRFGVATVYIVQDLIPRKFASLYCVPRR